MDPERRSLDTRHLNGDDAMQTKTEYRLDQDDRATAIITLVYYDAEGKLVDSEELRISPDAGSIWIKPSERILSWPTVRTVRASLARSPVTPIDIDVHLLPPACEHRSQDSNPAGAHRF
jgi:hypothetical protein